MRVQQLNALYAELKERGGAGGGPLAVATVRGIHAVLHKALNDAAKQDLAAYNVASKATLPKRDIHLDQPQRRGFRAWDAQQLRGFLSLVGGHRLEAAFVVAANTGMRRGEVLGLRWEDVDLDGLAIYVRRALGCTQKRAYLKAPKTNRPRTISIDAGTAAALRARRRDQAGHRLVWPGEWANDWDLVFTREDGRWVNPMQLTDAFRKTVAPSDLPRIRLHDLRHTHATLLQVRGVASDASTGHRVIARSG